MLLDEIFGDSAARFPSGEVIRSTMVFTSEVSELMDVGFWGARNIIKPEIFIENAAWTSLVAKGVVPSRQSLRVDYDAEVSRVFDQAKLAMPGKVWPVSGGRDGSHSEHLSRLLTEMQVLPRAYPDAKW